MLALPPLPFVRSSQEGFINSTNSAMRHPQRASLVVGLGRRLSLTQQEQLREARGRLGILEGLVPPLVPLVVVVEEVAHRRAQRVGEAQGMRREGAAVAGVAGLGLLVGERVVVVVRIEREQRGVRQLARIMCYYNRCGRRQPLESTLVYPPCWTWARLNGWTPGAHGRRH